MLLSEILVIVHIILCISLVGLILIQQGKGADAGAAFGSGASSTVFGSQGSGSFLTRATGILATLFFTVCLALAYYSIQRIEPKSALETVPVEAPVNSDLPPVKETGNDLPPVETGNVGTTTLPPVQP
ncbi:preprotein translocase subunit SecG [Candidatus Halobeggiatoa sp. HSG11]|nr:preprotein translocase subunit SecG [Candidatus Halobeggiatoa sp. HSG11]